MFGRPKPERYLSVIDFYAGCSFSLSAQEIPHVTSSSVHKGPSGSQRFQWMGVSLPFLSGTSLGRTGTTPTPPRAHFRAASLTGRAESRWRVRARSWSLRDREAPRRTSCQSYTVTPLARFVSISNPANTEPFVFSVKVSGDIVSFQTEKLQRLREIVSESLEQERGRAVQLNIQVIEAERVSPSILATLPVRLIATLSKTITPTDSMIAEISGKTIEEVSEETPVGPEAVLALVGNERPSISDQIFNQTIDKLRVVTPKELHDLDLQGALRTLILARVADRETSRATEGV